MYSLSLIKRLNTFPYWRCLSSSSQSFVAVESPPENIPNFLTNDLLRDPKKRALDLYMPHRTISYEEELKLKQRQVESRLQSVAKTLFYDRALHPSIRKLIRSNDVNLCSIRDIERVSATSEYMTTCIADLGRTRSGNLALGLPNRSTNHEVTTTPEDGQMMFVLPMDDIDIYKKRDRFIVQHYHQFLDEETKTISNLEHVLHHWRPIRIHTNKKDEKLVVIGYYDRKNKSKNYDAARDRLLKYFSVGPGRECRIDHLYFERRVQRWPIIVPDSSYEHIIGENQSKFHYDFFGMKFEANLQSFGIANLTAYESIYAEILKLCNLDPTSTIFLHHFSDLGVLPMIVSQNVDRSFGLDPNSFAIESSLKTQEKYPHTQNVEFNVCTVRDDLLNLLKKIENEKKKKSSMTCVFGPIRPEHERQDLRQNKVFVNLFREFDMIDRLIVVNRGLGSSILHFLYSLSGGESTTHKISGPPFKPVMAIPFDSNPRSGLLPDFLMIYERE